MKPLSTSCSAVFIFCIGNISRKRRIELSLSTNSQWLLSPSKKPNNGATEQLRNTRWPLDDTLCDDLPPKKLFAFCLEEGSPQKREWAKCCLFVKLNWKSICGCERFCLVRRSLPNIWPICGTRKSFLRGNYVRCSLLTEHYQSHTQNVLIYYKTYDWYW